MDGQDDLKVRFRGVKAGNQVVRRNARNAASVSAGVASSAGSEPEQGIPAGFAVSVKGVTGVPFALNHRVDFDGRYRRHRHRGQGARSPGRRLARRGVQSKQSADQIANLHSKMLELATNALPPMLQADMVAVLQKVDATLAARTVNTTSTGKPTRIG